MGCFGKSGMTSGAGGLGWGASVAEVDAEVKELEPALSVDAWESVAIFSGVMVLAVEEDSLVAARGLVKATPESLERLWSWAILRMVVSVAVS